MDTKYIGIEFKNMNPDCRGVEKSHNERKTQYDNVIFDHNKFYSILYI